MNLSNTLGCLRLLFTEGACNHVTFVERDGVSVAVLIDAWCGTYGNNGQPLCDKGPHDKGYIIANNLLPWPCSLTVHLRSAHPDSLLLVDEVIVRGRKKSQPRTELDLTLLLPGYYAKKPAEVLTSDVRFGFQSARPGSRARVPVFVSLDRVIDSDSSSSLRLEEHNIRQLTVYLPSEAASSTLPESRSNSASSSFSRETPLKSPQCTKRAADVLILSALQTECSAVEEFLPQRKLVHDEAGHDYEVGVLETESGKVRVAFMDIAAKGNDAAAAATAAALCSVKPKVAVFVGIAGGRKDVEVGDIIVACKVYRYDSGKDTDAFASRPEAAMSSPRLVRHARRVARSNSWSHRAELVDWAFTPRVHFGATAAGEKVVGNNSHTAKLVDRSYSDSLGVDMEDAGFLCALEGTHVDGIVIRGVSDLLKGEHAIPEDDRQAIAAKYAAAFAFEVLRTLPTH
jgi:nucleoside phosphorylase